ncbi:MAG: hypothetical protein HUJ90_07760, partial [Bacteroidales bacterium]|nr:hypothetical protein [Bacteroidales bacterium]
TLDLIRVNTALDAAKRAEEAAELAAYYAEKAENAEKKAARTAVELASEVGNANDNYYYQDGVFYVIENGQYKVIPAPIGAMVSELPEDYEEVVLNGKLYYQVDQTLFKLSASNGAPYFEVVSNI